MGQAKDSFGNNNNSNKSLFAVILGVFQFISSVVSSCSIFVVGRIHLQWLNLIFNHTDFLFGSLFCYHNICPASQSRCDICFSTSTFLLLFHSPFACIYFSHFELGFFLCQKLSFSRFPVVYSVLFQLYDFNSRSTETVQL